MNETQNVTQILRMVEKGDPSAAEVLLPLLYEELRKLAAAKLAQEKPGQTLQATALVHEAYLRLVGSDVEIHWNGRGHFFAAAAQAMRRVLVENARRKKSQKHGGEHLRISLSGVSTDEDDHRLLQLDDALDSLQNEDSIAADVVKLRHFSGMNHEQIAEALGPTVYQVRQKWAYARAWLSTEMG